MVAFATPAYPASRIGARDTVAKVTALLRGIPEEGNTLGAPHAPVTLQWFGDLECPACRYFTYHTLPTLINKFVRPGKLKIEYHAFDSATAEPALFVKQQVAALASGQQDKMWYFIELFYHEQGREYTDYVTESYLKGLANQIPELNLATWMAARSSPALAAEVESDARIGESYMWETTPDFFFREGKILAPFHPESAEPSVFASAIREHLAIAARAPS